MHENVLAFEAALLSMDRVRCRALLGEVMAAEGRMQAMEGIVVPTMERIGLAWQEGRVALSLVYMCGRICEEALEPILPPPSLETGGPVIGLAVFEDQHQLGKRIVGSVLRSGGFQVKDYGKGLGAEELAAQVLKDRIPLLMVSVLMLHSALHLRKLKAALGPEGPPLIAGGAPFRFDPTLGQEVGVDAVGLSAMDALRLARHYLGAPCLA